jgi:hypothetical protein
MSGSAGFTYGSITSDLINPAQVPALTYVFASQDANILFGNRAPRNYQQSQISLRGSDRVIYNAPDGFLGLSQPGPSNGGFVSGLRYVLLAVQNVTSRDAVGNLDIIERRSVAGTSTIASDVPRTGVASYRILLTSASFTSTGQNGFVAQDATLTLDYAAGTFRGTITAASTVSNVPARTITFTISGQLNGTSNRIVGSITSADGSAGQFAGELYGPAGIELGVAFSFQNGAEKVAGTIVGVKR